MATPAVLPQRHPARAADIWPNPARPTCCPDQAGGTALVTHQFENQQSLDDQAPRREVSIKFWLLSVFTKAGGLSGYV
jgi:hypothetical protein